MNTTTKQWTTALSDLPQPLAHAYNQAAICGDHIYILGRSNNVTYTCSIHSLVQPYLKERVIGVWKKVAAPPVKHTTFVSVRGLLLAIGGEDTNEEPATAIHMYNPTTNSWEVISHMRTPRRECIAAVLPNNQLMVVGGQIDEDFLFGIATDLTELATIELL